jgi:hypothetical protein
MANYWLKRYVHTLAKIERAQSSETRAAYRDLAAHYDAMRHFCERHVVRPENRSAG